MKPIWSGSISLGLVNIPVRLFSAVSDSSLDLDLLDSKDHSRIRYMRVNEKTHKEVPWERIARGYNYRGRYIVLTDADFEKAMPEKTKRIDILSFSDSDEVDSMYFETPYYLAPTEAGTHAYVLLRQAMEKTKRVAVTSFVLRNKEHLAILKPVGRVIVLNTIRFHDELRPTRGFKIPAKVSVRPKELQMAVSLVNQLAHAFDITRHADTYSAQLLSLIRAKARGKAPKARRTVKVPRPVDLMSQLKESLKTHRKKAA